MPRKKTEARLPKGPPPGGDQPIERKTKWGTQKTTEEGNTWGRARGDVIRRARASIITEMALKGVSKPEIGRHFGISKQRVQQIAKWAEQNGIVEEVRERIRQQLLPKAENVYAQLFDLPAAALADRSVQKGYELKLKAAKHIADGVGAFRRQNEDSGKVTQSMDLEEFMLMRRSKLEDAAHHPAFAELSRGDGNPSGDHPDSPRGGDEIVDVWPDSEGEE